MIPLTLGDIARVTSGVVHGDASVAVGGEFAIDSRRVVPGSLFVAVVGERVDGHTFAVDAVGAGAVGVLGTRRVPGVPCVVVGDVVAALAELARYVLGRLPSVTIAGITGSSGKTSVKDLAASLVSRLGPTVAPAGSFNTEYGLPLTVLRCDPDTRYLVLEMSARGIGHIAYLCGIAPPRFGVVLNVGRAHAGEFGSMEAVATAKGELVEALPSDGVAILNADDSRVLAMASRTSAPAVTFSALGAAAADLRAADVRLDSLGRAQFALLTPEGSAQVSLRLHGAHQVSNALAAAALARSLGLGLDDIADGLSTATARSRWRMEVTTRPDGVIVVNDAYNANPESMRAALDAVGHLARDGRAFAVLGHMAELGSVSRTAHEEIGSYAASIGVAGLIAVGHEASPLLDGARQVTSWQGEALAVPSGPAAAAALHDRLKPGDVVLVKASRSASLEGVAAELLTSDSPPEGRQ